MEGGREQDDRGDKKKEDGGGQRSCGAGTMPKKKKVFVYARRPLFS